jgi:dihydrofolate reductase
LKAATKRAKKKSAPKPAAKLKTTVFCGVSVDGFLARPDDTLDFLDAGGSAPHGFEEFMSSVDVVVLGRRTFDVVAKYGHFGLYGKRRVVVLSNQQLDLGSIKGGNFEQMCGTPEELVAKLTASGAKHAYIDGGITIRSFLQAGLIDRLIVTRVPVLIGQGVPLFGPLPQDIYLEHVATRSFKGGLVQSEYAVGKRKQAAKK